MSTLKRPKIYLFLLLIIGSTILSGCLNRTSTVDEMYEVLENVVTLEKDFEDQQEPLVELEREEKEIYSQIIALGMKEFDQIVSLSNEALTIVGKRQEFMQKEEDSIQASKKEFGKLKPLIGELEDENLKKKANELYDTMMERYESHDALFAKYTKGLGYDKELYEMFQNEELSIEQLEEQIAKINETYKIVLESNEQFNEHTKKYNEIKLDFYKAAGIEVDEKENNQ
ncbi:hypothetical protein EKG37_09480 [Robertmurraya yapensis]|uniref:Cell-wall binding lipoprotein n=2 Tax=Bacillaceae TaxID=186817 RepID=A0A431WA42_9BACI|nr:YkyA family protein [Bacillus yapensis]RTR32384.1 hypothetical protein EKG37_09480 [Bacillus yapensis]TKS96578.1 hypothetical protein FAR12_09480 [Bacillus yapensis]